MKTKVINSLFDLVEAEANGLAPELKSDPILVEKITAALEKAISQLAKMDSESRRSVVLRVTHALNIVTPAAVCVVFSREKKKPSGDSGDLFLAQTEAKPENRPSGVDEPPCPVTREEINLLS